MPRNGIIASCESRKLVPADDLARVLRGLAERNRALNNDPCKRRKLEIPQENSAVRAEPHGSPRNPSGSATKRRVRDRADNPASCCGNWRKSAPAELAGEGLSVNRWESWLGWFVFGSPSETKGISRSRDTGKTIDSKWATQNRQVRAVAVNWRVRVVGIRDPRRIPPGSGMPRWRRDRGGTPPPASQMARSTPLEVDREPWEPGASPEDRRSHEGPGRHGSIQACGTESEEPYRPDRAPGCWVRPSRGSVYACSFSANCCSRWIIGTDGGEMPANPSQSRIWPVPVGQVRRRQFLRPDGTSRKCARP